MSDFDYSGYGVFESLASEQVEERRATRKALVTAQARVEDSLGRWFKAAKTGEEFDERYALVQQEFVATIQEAAAEFGVRPGHIANTIFAHYRTAAYKQAGHKCPSCGAPVGGDYDRECGDCHATKGTGAPSEGQRDSKIARDCGCGDCDPVRGCACGDCTVGKKKESSFIKGSPDPGDDAYFGGEHGSAKKAFDAMKDQYGDEKGEEVYYATRNKHKGKKKSKAEREWLKKEADKWIQKAVDSPDFDKGGLHRATDTPEGENIPESKIENLEEHGTPDEKKKAQFAENVKKGAVHTACSCSDGKCDCGDDCDCGSDCSCCGGKKSSFLAGDSTPQGHCTDCGKEGYLKHGLCGPCRKDKWDEGHSPKAQEDESQGDLDALNDEYDTEAREAAASNPPGPDPLMMQEGQGSMAQQAQALKGGQPKAAPGQPHPQGSMPPEAGGMTPGTIYDNPFKMGHMRWAAEGFDADDSYETEKDKLGEGKEAPGNSGLSDKASPVIDKGPARKDGDQGWSLDPIDVPSKKHPTVQMDATVPLPRENIKTTVKDQVKGIGESVTEVQELPTATGLDGGGFAENNQDMAPNTQTWPNDSREQSPVTHGNDLETVSHLRWAAVIPDAKDPMRTEWTPEQVQQPKLCPRCGGQGCNDCKGTGKVTAKVAWYPGQQGNSDEELAYLDEMHPIDYEGIARGLEAEHQAGRPHDRHDCPLCPPPIGEGDPYGYEPPQGTTPVIPAGAPPYDGDIPF